jgi:hypothetical protein
MAENTNCAATHATFRLVGADVRPDVLTQALGISPTFKVAVGEITPKNTRPRTEGIWAISTKEMLGSTDLEEHVIALLAKLPLGFRNHVPPGSRCEIQCFWRSATGHGGPSLSSSLLARLGAAGIDLDFDFYSDV